MDVRGLDEDERALLAACRRDPVERELLAVWRRWERHPSTRPLWAAELQQRLAVDARSPGTGLSGRTGGLPGTSARVQGLLLGGAVGEFAALGRVGQRTGALLFALEGLIRAHTQLRSDGSGEPTSAVFAALRRWLHTRGVPWRDCGTGSPRPSGALVAERGLHDLASDEPTMLTSVAKVVAGHPQGTRQQPINAADSATAVPFGALAALWSGDPGAVFALGGDLAALTHGHPHGHSPASVLASTTLWLMRGNDLETSLRQGISGWQSGRTALGEALRLGMLSPAGFRPGRAHLGASRSGLGALAVAARVALACEDDFAAALAAATEHDGDAASAAMLCGQLLGALHGPTAIPAELLERLPIVEVVERLGRDAATEFGPEPDESAGWEERYPADDSAATATLPSTADYRTGLTGVPRLAASRDRFLGAVLGCAVGEALGMPIASDTWDEIRARHGDEGLTEYVPAGHPSGRVGSDTQLLLFSVEGLLRANVARRAGEAEDPIRHLQHAYQRWLHTQHLSWPRAAGEFLRVAPEPDGWLVRERALFQTRNPGRTMMRTLIAFAKGQQPVGAPDQPVSDSAGSDAILRAIPAALWSDDPSEVFALGMRSAALTHGHPTALLSAGVLGYLVARSLLGEHLADAVTGALTQLAPHAGHQEVTRRLTAARDLARGDRLSPEELERALGTAATAAEALAFGLHAALVADGDVDSALRIAANHSGGSAVTAAVAGSLTAAGAGASTISRRWTTELELHDVVEQLARDAVREFGPRPPASWDSRYPPT
ncbi:ADP-ribosylglycohydrolase family protein [Saccharopolyspora rhizosphaerae]|uniref:ADP-ribosylglycohydrolase family protein n=1 Tax=Saccharopolyspora rhizosphaerae TaxID=2492662 RepID=A0A3R8QTP0_9PSEU|nr:ADP-ribosylglycohydrolase family protein [Saccharopolyspora rhizosphaerae]RRO19302.1 ADP-ribosylglycohydrolase family protein [Saccharopolyspora rhizosphaerae]